MITLETVSKGDSAMMKIAVLIDFKVLEEFCDPLWMISMLLHLATQIFRVIAQYPINVHLKISTWISRRNGGFVF